MATHKQKAAVDKIIENRGNIGKSMIEVGYSENSAKNPKNLTESKGFKELCEERGLTDNFLLDALKEDIENKKGNRKQELELAFKVKGRLKENEDPGQTNNYLVFVGDGRAEEIARRVLARGQR